MMGKSLMLVSVVVLVTGITFLSNVETCTRHSTGKTPTASIDGETYEPPTNQSETPQPPPAVASSCGHSKYYYNTSIPGSGIVGGINATQNQYPWLVLIDVVGAAGAYFCGADIISETFLLTAGHCTVGAISNTAITAHIGDYDAFTYEPGELTITSTEIITHPLFNNGGQLAYDFGLIRLKTPLNFSSSWNVQKICLPTSCSDGCEEGAIAYIAGWGRTSEGGDPSNIPQTAYVKIANHDVCAHQFKNFDLSITDQEICAGYAVGGVDACNGDSGGPLMTVENGYYKLCGVTSWSIGCARPNLYGVYARVCSVLDWIKKTTGIA